MIADDENTISKTIQLKKTISNESYKMQFCNQHTFNVKVSRVHFRLSKRLSISLDDPSLEFMFLINCSLY